MYILENGNRVDYCKVSNIRHTKFQNWNDSRPVLHLSLPNLLKPCIKEARYKIIQIDRFSWKKSRTNISLWWFWIYQIYIRLPCYFFCYMHFKVAWNSISALKSAFIYDVIILCLKAWYVQLTSKNLFFSKDNYFYLHKSHISVNCNW